MFVVLCFHRAASSCHGVLGAFTELPVDELSLCLWCCAFTELPTAAMVCLVLSPSCHRRPSIHPSIVLHIYPSIYPSILCVCALCILHFALCILHFAFCILHSALCILQFAFCILHFAFCILHFAFCVLHCAFCIVHCAFCILHFAFCVLRFA